MKIAVMGTRGIPANYGGFETFAEELSRRLADRGHQVCVYGRPRYVDSNLEEFLGVEIKVLPSISSKHLDTVFHTTLSVFHGLTKSYDAVLVCNAANAFLCWIPRLFGQKTALNVDGIERLRKKWGTAGKLFYRLGEWMAIWAPGRVVADAMVISDYYLERYGKKTEFIPYGASGDLPKGKDKLRELGLREREYLLYVSRLEPENNADLLIKSYLASGVSDIPLVIVGDAPYAEEYLSELRKLAAGGNVLMPGSIYGEGYRELLANCACYFQGSEVGGTHPALLEAMGAGAIVVSHDTPENREVLSGNGLICDFYDSGALGNIIVEIYRNRDRFIHLGDQARARVKKVYSWERITDQYENLFYEMVNEAGGSSNTA